MPLGTVQMPTDRIHSATGVGGSSVAGGTRVDGGTTSILIDGRTRVDGGASVDRRVRADDGGGGTILVDGGTVLMVGPC